MPESMWFSDVLKGYKMKTFARHDCREFPKSSVQKMSSYQQDEDSHWLNKKDQC